MNQTARFILRQCLLAFVFFTTIAIKTGRCSFHESSTKIAELKNYSPDEKKDIYNSFDMENQNDQGLPIDPFDLMNRLKQAGAMNDATSPSDAIDEALNAFNDSEYENVPIE